MPKRKRKKTTEAETLGTPTTWRQQHSDFTPPTRIPDPEDGTPVSVRRAITPLERMEANGTISPAMRQAGEQFQTSFRAAALDPLRPAPLLRTPKGTGDTLTERVEAARHRIALAMEALGGSDSAAGSCVWHVVGCETSIREWATRCGWGGRPIGHSQAQGVLVAALGVLVTHYRIEAPRRRRPA